MKNRDYRICEVCGKRTIHPDDCGNICYPCTYAPLVAQTWSHSGGYRHTSEKDGQ